jgi:signal-transduction protein with cAMP-binding, CBS, and nucleotidyltransferase domain
MLSKRTVLEAKRFGVYQCNHSQTLAEAAQRMVEEDVSALVVVDDEGCLAGILSRTDLMRALMAQKDWKSTSVQSLMNNQVVTVGPHASLLEVAQLLLEHQIHRVVVVKEEEGKMRPLSVISAADIVYHMVKEE